MRADGWDWAEEEATWEGNLRIAAAVKRDHAEAAQLLMEAKNGEVPIVVIMEPASSTLSERRSSLPLGCPVRPFLVYNDTGLRDGCVDNPFSRNN